MFDALFQQLPEAIIVVDPHKDRIVYHNNAAQQLWFNVGFDDLSAPVSYYFRTTLAVLITFSEAVLHSGKGLCEELCLVHENNTEAALEVTGSRIEAAQEYLCFCLRDKKTHEQWKVQAQAKRHHAFGLLEWNRIHEVFYNIEKENQLILSAAGEGIYGVNAEGLATFFNPAAERMTGWQAKEVIGKNIHALIHHTHKNGSDFCAHECPIYAAFKEGTIKRVTDDVFWTKQGNSLPVDYTSTPILDNGQLVGAVVIFRDITERIAADDKLRSALIEVKQLKKKLEQENAYLQEEINAEYNFHHIVGKSLAVSHVIQKIQMVAPTNATVLINGESGTGKELIARAIHAASNRSERPLVRANCAAIPRELFESEFFGHIKGAFSGAVTDRIGRFELADGGTLFLDEVGEIPLELQGKLLRVLQDNEFERVGESSTRTVDTRIIAATNKNLKALVAKGLFREDLYFRLNVFPVVSAPLRERVVDIPLLVTHFLTKICQRLNKKTVTISLAQVQKLQAYDWPGNIRELENYLERQIILSPGSKLAFEDLPAGHQALHLKQAQAPLFHQTSESLNNVGFTGPDGYMTREQLNDLKIKNICTALKQSRGKVYGEEGAAVYLGIKPTTLASQIKKYGIDPRIYKAGSTY